MAQPERSAPARQRRRERGRSEPASTRRLDKLIEDATVDWSDDSEQVTGFHTMLEEHLEEDGRWLSNPGHFQVVDVSAVKDP